MTHLRAIDLIVRQQQQPFHYVLQLTNISWPRVRLQHSDCLGRKWDHLIVRSARTLHTVCIPLPAPVLKRLRTRHERYPNDECVFSSECLRESKMKLQELSQKVLGRALNLEHIRDAKLNGWVRFNSKASL